MKKSFTITNNWILYAISTLLMLIIVFKVIFEFNLLSNPTDTYKQQFLITENRQYLADINKNLFMAKTANEIALQSVYELSDKVRKNLEILNTRLITDNTLENIDLLQRFTEIENKWFYVEDQLNSLSKEPVWVKQQVEGYLGIDSISRINPNYLHSLNVLSNITNEVYVSHVELNELLLSDVAKFVYLVESNVKISIILDTLGLLAVISLFIYFSSMTLTISSYDQKNEEKIYSYQELRPLDYKRMSKKINISESV